MGKRIALKDSIEVDGDDLSTYCRSIAFTSEDERVDAAGFNPTGASEFLTGLRTQEITCEFVMSRATGGPHGVLWPLHNEREEFEFVWRPDQTAPVSAENPELRGNAMLPTFGEGATRGELEVASFTFVASDAAGFQFYIT